MLKWAKIRLFSCFCKVELAIHLHISRKYSNFAACLGGQSFHR